MTKPHSQDLSIPDSGVLLTLTASGLQATLPSGRSIPIQDGPKGLDRIYYLLLQQSRIGRKAAQEAKLGTAADPTLAYLEHYEQHVNIMIPRKAPGCPFCSITDPGVFLRVLAPKGEALRLQRQGKAKADKSAQNSAEDLGL